MSGLPSLVRCQVCSELNNPGRSICWLCEQPLEPRTVDPVIRGPEIEPVSEEGASLFHSSLVVAPALLLVLLGVGLVWPGLGIVLAIVLVIPFLRTAALARRRAEAGAEDAFPFLVGSFVGSTLATFVVIAVVGVVGFGTFCITCFGVGVSTNNIHLAVLGSGLLAIIVLIPVCRRLARWVRNRWRRDVKRRSL